MQKIIRGVILAAALLLAACGSANPVPDRASSSAATALNTAAPTPATPPAQAQGKPRFIDFYATW